VQFGVLHQVYGKGGRVSIAVVAITHCLRKIGCCCDVIVTVTVTIIVSHVLFQFRIL
jgi:hypothetical protein